MPIGGFKSITVHDHVYDKFYQIWLESKSDLASKGVSSFSGYIQYLIEQSIRKDVIFTKYEQVYTKILVENKRIVLKDSLLDRIIEISNDTGELYCYFCERNDCKHVGFCWSFPEIYG